MRFPIIVCALALASCGSNEAPVPEVAPEQAATTEPVSEAISPPRRAELAAAWSEACPDAEPANKGLCKSKGFGDPGFTCDFALGDGEYRRHTAELTQLDGKWVLADPQNACAIE